MSRNSAVALILLFGLIAFPRTSLAQLTPPAGSAGAGNSSISGVPYGPANPSSLSDPSGIGNASRMPPLGTNSPVPIIPAPAIAAPRSTTSPVVGASQRLTIPQDSYPRRRQFRGRGKAQVSKFTGICRGC